MAELGVRAPSGACFRGLAARRRQHSQAGRLRYHDGAKMRAR